MKHWFAPTQPPKINKPHGSSSALFLLIVLLSLHVLLGQHRPQHCSYGWNVTWHTLVSVTVRGDIKGGVELA